MDIDLPLPSNPYQRARAMLAENRIDSVLLWLEQLVRHRFLLRFPLEVSCGHPYARLLVYSLSKAGVVTAGPDGDGVRLVDERAEDLWRFIERLRAKRPEGITNKTRRTIRLIDQLIYGPPGDMTIPRRSSMGDGWRMVNIGLAVREIDR